ncbi:hypothetical protein TSOC_003967 [Tetrabaena socialis]|uniref:Rab-GAP TBC domain-containing protein n=1 Tax=Tetrabaena socialis TaxID=47790 RepID=A0A2J8AA73_9CHLO|nr:hypothetical protein TSOC_003967 [Tetrabaena socialis]|eukprot:PNH09383.1 hypothetical protein TSOC_003967 [Tetrabaena socialis]
MSCIAGPSDGMGATAAAAVRRETQLAVRVAPAPTKALGASNHAADLTAGLGPGVLALGSGSKQASRPGVEGAGRALEPGSGGGSSGPERCSAWRQYLAWSERPHRDSSVVEVDVARSLWAFTRGAGEAEREARRRQLKRMLNAVVAADGGGVSYYQGLHDVAGVLLLATHHYRPQPPTPHRASPPRQPRYADLA